MRLKNRYQIIENDINKRSYIKTLKEINLSLIDI